MLNESFPVKHKTMQKLGGGIVVGGFPVTELKNNTPVTNFYFLVLWENNPMPSPHKNSDLEHLVDHHQWYADYFNDDDNDDDSEEENEEEEEDENLEAGTSFFEQEEIDETGEAEVIPMENVITHEQSLDGFDNDSQDNNLDM